VISVNAELIDAHETYVVLCFHWLTKRHPWRQEGSAWTWNDLRGK